MTMLPVQQIDGRRFHVGNYLFMQQSNSLEIDGRSLPNNLDFIQVSIYLSRKAASLEIDGRSLYNNLDFIQVTIYLIQHPVYQIDGWSLQNNRNRWAESAIINLGFSLVTNYLYIKATTLLDRWAQSTIKMLLYIYTIQVTGLF